MKGIGLVHGAAATLAALGLLVPQTPVLAQSGPAATRATASANATQAADVVLINGALTGRVVDHQGTPAADHEVIVKQGEKEIARGKTNDKGVFSMPNVKPGNYTASAGKTEGRFRVWSEKTAPPVAKGHALLVLGQNGDRGQFGAVDPTLVLLTVGVIATLIVAAINLNKTKDLEDQIDKLPKSN
jgi:hypothetical protein